MTPLTPSAPRALLEQARAMGRCEHCGREPYVGRTDTGWAVLRSHDPDCDRNTTTKGK